MIRQPAIKRASRGLKKASTYSLPPPVGGWNARDPLANMKETDAVILENWYPMASNVVLRKGCENWVTGFVSEPLTLLDWNGHSTEKLFAATSTDIYSVTSSGAVGASVATCTNGSFIHTNISVAGGTYLVAVNGVDKLKLYDGTTWLAVDGTTTPAITGLATTSLSYVAVLKRRLWFVQKNSMSAWYLPTASIGGALTEFPLGEVFTLGGHLTGMASWTVDGGDGADDYTVFMSSKGQVAVYKGTDPASSSTFSKVGLFYIGEPLGLNCFAQYGGDLLILSQNGLFPMSKALQSATIDRAQSLTAKIDTAFTEAASLYGSNPGWAVCVFPQGSFVLVNVPISTYYSEQYVMNSITGAWCKFQGIYANDWLVFDKQLYFASLTKVAKAWTGTSDFGGSIQGNARQAYNYFRARGRQKHSALVRPTISTTGAVNLSLSLDADFSDAAFSSVPAASASSGFEWDASDALWDSAEWAPDSETSRNWSTVPCNPFFAAALGLQASSSDATISWSSTDFVYQLGGVL